jgi:hypothetical protein
MSFQLAVVANRVSQAITRIIERQFGLRRRRCAFPMRS